MNFDDTHCFSEVLIINSQEFRKEPGADPRSTKNYKCGWIKFNVVCGTHHTSRDPLICCADLHKSLKKSNFLTQISQSIKETIMNFLDQTSNISFLSTSDHRETKKFQLKSCFSTSNIERANVSHLKP